MTLLRHSLGKGTRCAAVLLVVCTPVLVNAQAGKQVAASIAQGDKATTERNSQAALTAYEAAITADANNVDALRKAAKVMVAMAEFGDKSQRPQRQALADKGEAYARRAFAKDSTTAEAHFVMAQALGRSAQINMVKGLTYAGLIYDHALACLKVQPKHAGCTHVIGAMHAELMRLNIGLRKATSMMVARIVSGDFPQDTTGGKPPIVRPRTNPFELASWDTAQLYLERAAAAEPNRTIHHLTLGRIYADRDEPEKARAAFAKAQKAPMVDFFDAEYKKQTAEQLEKLPKK